MSINIYICIYMCIYIYIYTCLRNCNKYKYIKKWKDLYIYIYIPPSRTNLGPPLLTNTCMNGSSARESAWQRLLILTCFKRLECIQPMGNCSILPHLFDYARALSYDPSATCWSLPPSARWSWASPHQTVGRTRPRHAAHGAWRLNPRAEGCALRSLMISFQIDLYSVVCGPWNRGHAEEMDRNGC